MTAEKRHGCDGRARVAFFGLQPKSRDGQFVSVADAQHLDPDQFRRNHDGVTAVARDRIDLLQPRRRTSVGIEISAVTAHVGDRAAGLDAAQHIPPSQMLVLDETLGWQ